MFQIIEKEKITHRETQIKKIHDAQTGIAHIWNIESCVQKYVYEHHNRKWRGKKKTAIISNF